MGKNDNEKKSFVLYYDWETLFASLDSNEEAGELIKALFAFAKRGEITEFSGALKMAFIFMAQQLEKDSIKWEERKIINTENGKKGGRPKKQTVLLETEKTERFLENQTKAKKGVNVNVNDNVNVNVNDNDSDMGAKAPITPTKQKRFEKPTLEQVQAYCRERKNNVNAERFVDYYESNGWKVGKNAMKDWKAAVRTWERNGYSNDCKNDSEEDLSGIPAEQLEILRKMRC